MAFDPDLSLGWVEGQFTDLRTGEKKGREGKGRGGWETNDGTVL
jgi:hypothetical protein